MNKKKYPTPATIVIRLNGDETTATIMGDEFRTRITRTLAKRSPKDEYDAYIGARVALDRLFDKDGMFADKMPEETKKAPEPEKTEAPKEKTGFLVGDIVRITNPIHFIPFLALYERGDVAVITEVKQTTSGANYTIKIRSKERKGKLAVVVGDELTLLHRPAKEGEKR